jgi:hypothetical protein
MLSEFAIASARFRMKIPARSPPSAFARKTSATAILHR